MIAASAPGETRLGPWTVVLFLGAFTIGCTEFVVVGMLAQIADGLGRTEAAIGQLVTLNALAVVVAAPALTARFAAMDRRRFLTGAMLVFAAAHLASAVTSSFVVLMLLRLVGGAAFGVWLAGAFAVVGRLAPPDKRSRAIGFVVAGLSTATALGAPVGTALGHAAGWHAPFAAIGLLGLGVAVALHRVLPPMAGLKTNDRNGIAVLANRAVVMAIAIIAVFWAGSFAAYTYVVPLLRESAGLSHDAVTAVLLLSGLMAIAGNLLGGRAADRGLKETLILTAATTAASLAVLWALRGIPVAAVALVALSQLAAWSFVPAIQGFLFGAGGEAAMPFSVSSFNLGILAGAGIGGAALDLGGLGAVMAAATALAVVALGLVMAATNRWLPFRSRTVSET